MQQNKNMRVKRSEYKILTSVFVMILSLCFILNAQAQDAMPSQEQLQTPGQETTPPQPEMMAKQTRGDPCPTPKEALSSTPDDLAQVQEEIDRFALCVQRAQLLERLNESSMKNQSATDSALGLNGLGLMPGLAGPQTGPNTLTPLPASAMEGIDLLPDDAPAPSAVAASLDIQPAPLNDWTINEIYGSGNQMQASLISPEGDEVRTRAGVKLPDGKSVVTRISPSGVTIKTGKKTRALEWARN